jgi:murein DD-endopeptidase MepM/ murein hydrolase activator NlpD
MIFPDLKGKLVGYVNLDEYAKRWLRRNGYEEYPSKSPLLDPRICQEMLDECHALLGLAYSYGGWLEDRSVLWRGSYLKEGDKYMHIGLDVNAPVGTKIALDMPGEVAFIDDDHPVIGGWGRRVIIQLNAFPIVLIYAHLGNITCALGDSLRSGDIFAEIGPSSHNGNWYTHTHVQAMIKEAYEMFVCNPSGLDGYGNEKDIAELAKLFPDPMRYIQLV